MLLQSSAISLVTGQQIARSDSVSSVTTQCELYSDLLGGGAAWLDTVGWEDRKKDDAESFKDILRSDIELCGSSIALCWTLPLSQRPLWFQIHPGGGDD